MSDQDTSGTGDLREQAATWFARMRGPEADGSRAAFETWLAENALHREVYSRIAEVFSLGKALSEPENPTADEQKISMRHTAAPYVAAALLLVGASGAALWTKGTWLPLSAERQTDGSIAASHEAIRGQVSTVIGQIRVVRLADGSRVTLDTDTELALNFDASHRQLRLLKGRARFDVAHERRPFIVSAARGTVTAHGTLFDVGLQENGEIHVRLLRGAIDVVLPAQQEGRGDRDRSERLSPGQQIVVTKDALMRAQAIASPIDARWPDAELDCDHLALSAVAAQANRYSATQIVLGDPGIGLLQVSGTFRIDNSERLATQLADVFALHVERDGPRRLILRK